MFTRSGPGATDVALLVLRIAVGLVFIVYGFAKVSHLPGTAALWTRLHLPAPAIMGPVQGVVEFLGGILVVLGLLTRPVAVLLALDMVGALVLVRIPRSAFQGGYALEWQACMIGVALALAGAGAFSLDRLLRRGAVRHPLVS